MHKNHLLVVTRNLPPLTGGMERLLWHVVGSLRSDYNVHVVGPQGCGQTLPNDVQVLEVSTKSIFSFLIQSLFKALLAAFCYRPAIVLAGSGVMAPIVWLSARFVRSKCVVYLHGLDIRAPHLLYQTFWLPFFRRFDSVLVNSHYTKQLAIDAGVSPERIAIVHPGVELPDMTCAKEQTLSFRSRYNLSQRPVLLFVGRITERKGLACFAEHILPHIISILPETRVVVIGGDPVDALQCGRNERQRVQDILKQNGLEEVVHFLGCLSDEELGDAYLSANALVFPVQESETDIEGFGMVALEAAAHGLPTVAFAVGGVPDAVSDGCCGKLILPGSNVDFAKAVIELLEVRADPDRVEICREFARKFEWAFFGKRLRSVLNKLN